MHSKYDGENNDGEDQPEYILNLLFQRAIGISMDGMKILWNYSAFDLLGSFSLVSPLEVLIAKVHKSMKMKG